MIPFRKMSNCFIIITDDMRFIVFRCLIVIWTKLNKTSKPIIICNRQIRFKSDVLKYNLISKKD